MHFSWQCRKYASENGWSFSPFRTFFAMSFHLRNKRRIWCSKQCRLTRIRNISHTNIIKVHKIAFLPFICWHFEKCLYRTVQQSFSAARTAISWNIQLQNRNWPFLNGHVFRPYFWNLLNDTKMRIWSWSINSIVTGQTACYLNYFAST